MKNDLTTAAREAYLIHSQLADMRENVRHITDLDGIRVFVQQFNVKMAEVREVLAGEPSIVKTLGFLEPISTDTSSSEYPSAIIDGKRGLFMVASGVLMDALVNYMRLHLSEEERERFGAARLFA